MHLCFSVIIVLFLLDNEHIYMELGQKLSKYCPKEWKREASKVLCTQSKFFLEKMYFFVAHFDRIFANCRELTSLDLLWLFTSEHSIMLKMADLLGETHTFLQYNSNVLGL